MTIDQAIKAAYPTGLLHEPYLEGARVIQAQQTVVEIAATLSRLTSVQASHQLRFEDEQYFAFASTLLPSPTADEWIRQYDNPRKLAYVAKHGGVLPLWWAKFSFIYPAYYHYFNLWSSRPRDPKYLDINFTEDAPDAEWESPLVIAERVIASYGFSTLPAAEYFRQVQFVRHEAFSDDDDIDEPTLEVCTVAQCLFSEC